MRLVDIGEAAPGRDAWPLTEAQLGLWYVQRIDPGNPILNASQYVELRGPLDIRLFCRAFDRMAEEADSLSLVFAETAFGPRQRLDAATRPRLQIVDLTAQPDPVAAARSAMVLDTATPVDLARGPVSAFTLYRLGAEHFFWYERIHHLAIDGYGIVLVTNRVGEIYSALKAGIEPGPAFAPLSQALAEDAAYLCGERRTQDHAFWMTELSGLPEVASLASGRAVSGASFHRQTVHLPAALFRQLTGRADALKVTWPDLLTVLVASYCRRFAAVPEAVIGLPFMGRLGSKAARVPCTLMNVLPVRFADMEDAPLAEVAVQGAKKLMACRRHGRYRSEQLRRDLGLIGGQRRLFGPLINVQPFDMPPVFAGLDVALHILGAGAVDDITFTFRGDAKASLMMEVDCNPALYGADDTAAHAERLVAYLEGALVAERLADVPLASPAEIRRYVRDANATAHPVPDVTLVDLIEATMRSAPDAPAVSFEGRVLTYAELERQSRALAEQLACRGAGPDRLVAVALPRSLDLVVALFAIVRAGAAYLPLDPRHPRERIQRILASARPVAILAGLAEQDLFDADTLHPGDWTREPSGATLPVPQPVHLAYVIYTSGSTGEPKGVMIEHRAIVNRLEWMRSHYSFGPQDRILQKTPATFDVSVWEFFLPALCGATLVVAPPEAHRDPQAMARLIRAEAITTLHFVPSMLSAFLAAPESEGLSVARVFCSGEELTPDQRDRFHARIRGELHNLYGPTEAAVDVSYWPATSEDRSAPLPIGWPVWNTSLMVLDEGLQPVPPGVAGHLFLGGVQLARGYLGRPDLTADRFLPDPFRPDGRLYRTGDLARLRPDGAVVFLGRSDHQVKIRGLRIELGEIEAALMASGLLREAVVMARADRAGDRRIVAYAVATAALDVEALRLAVARRLPDYMVPSAFVILDALPVTANGKLDRAALPAPVIEGGQGRPAETASERLLARLYRDLLALDSLPDVEGDFFSLGGDSLSAVHLVLRIKEETGLDPGLGAVFEQPTIAGLAAVLDRAGIDHGLGPIIRLAEGEAARAPLFLIHPAGGIAWGYRHLARALGGQRTVYGVQSPALDPDVALPDSLEVLATAYVDRIVETYPSGPWHVAGWSVGGILAQAMAAELEARGLAAGMIAMLDSYPCECWRAEPEPDETAALLAIAGHDPLAHPDLTTRAAITAFLRQGGSPLGSLPDAALDGVIRVVLDTNRLVRGHYHRRFGGTVVHVRAALDHQDRDLTPGLWAPHVGAIDRVDVPFLHPQLTSPAATAEIAPQLARRLAAFDTEKD
ncbi:amino acid adenylation domain-containing protein [Rhizobium sp. CSW-27]|nr:amino acid adenylation domain-containing protein [Rhizobium sp. CSW-27]